MALLWWLPLAVHADTFRVRVPNEPTLDTQHIRHYYEQLIHLALEKTRKPGEQIVIERKSISGGPERERASLAAGVIDIAWGSVIAARKRQLQWVPVDLLKDMNSYRVFVIRRDQQARFAQVDSLASLRKLVAGSGINWAGANKFEASGIKVITSGSFVGLYKMLAAGRVDYIFRGPHEYASELKLFGNLDIDVAQSLVVRFAKPMPFSFFVSKQNQALGRRLEQGLLLAQADGSFDALFNQYPYLVAAHQWLQDESRRVIVLSPIN